MQPSWPKINQLPLTRFLEKRLVRVKSRVYGKLWWSCREIIAFSSIIDYPFVESQSTLRKRWFCLKYFFRNFEEASQKVSRSFFFPFSFVLFSFFLSFFLKCFCWKWVSNDPICFSHKVLLTISRQCPISLTPEKVRKPLVYRNLWGVKWSFGVKCV